MDSSHTPHPHFFCPKFSVGKTKKSFLREIFIKRDLLNKVNFCSCWICILVTTTIYLQISYCSYIKIIYQWFLCEILPVCLIAISSHGCKSSLSSRLRGMTLWRGLKLCKEMQIISFLPFFFSRPSLFCF